MKLVTLAICGLVALGIFGRWDLKVSGTARLEPAVRRVYAAPFDRAILVETFVLPGQIVHKGEKLFRFDEEELTLSLREAQAKLIATRKQMDVHFSKQEMADYKIADAQADELAAQIELLNYRLSQAVVSAEFDGVVLKGDLRQVLRRPFQMGETLLEVAPLEDLLLLVEVEQTDVALVEQNMRGSFATKARPDVTLDFTVKKIRPMSEVREQENVFVIEADVRNTDQWLRPGMEAAANISTGEHNITWVVTRKLINWFRLKFFI
jgi:multidrug efflux pump subunit AcrA (membrane-fusion protein)